MSFRKLVSGILIATVVVTGSALSIVVVPQSAHAQATVNVNSIGHIPGSIISKALVATGISSSATAGSTAATTAILKVLDGIAWSVAKMTVNSITKSTVNWINSGFNGSPAFVTDLQANLGHLSDAVADEFFAQLNGTVEGATGFNIESPFKDQLASQLKNDYYQQTSRHGLNPYTLNQCSQDPSAFINQGRFSQGGFNAWFCASQNPANNPFGAYLQASNELWASIDIATQNRKLEVQMGNGFLSFRGSCNASNTASGMAVNTTVSQTQINNLNSALGIPSSASTQTTAPSSLSTAEQCPNNKIQTPGSVINASLEKSLGSGIDQLDLADSINEVVGALASQLVNQVLGAGGLAGASQPMSGGGSSYANQVGDSSQYAAQTSSLADGFIDTLNDEQTNANEYSGQWQIILDAANAAQQKCGVQSDITSVITQANTAISKASAANNQINSILTQVQAAKTSGNSTTIASILSQNNAMLTNSPVSASDLSYATTQSTDSGTDSPVSLLTQMTNKQKSCGVAASTH